MPPVGRSTLARPLGRGQCAGLEHLLDSLDYVSRLDMEALSGRVVGVNSTIPYTRSTADFPSNVHDEAEVIRRKITHLHRLATAAATLGNDRLADDLFDIASTLRDAETSIREHVSARIDSDLKASQQISGALIGAALAGVRLGSAAKEGAS